MTEDLDNLMCPHSAAGRPEHFPAKACVLAGECGCAYGAEWSRALRLADDAAESVHRVTWSIKYRLLSELDLSNPMPHLAKETSHER